ncbi:CFDP2 [Symbiodinium sp. KB8]|nr:CFDP2 [Symbiodinium sp. KB8]
MGRGDKWNRPQQGGHYEQSRPQYQGGYGGRQESQRPWRVWPGAFSPSGRGPKSDGMIFPRYDARPPSASHRNQDYATAKESPMEEPRGGLVSDAQHFINMARKAESRVKSLTQNRKQRETQWDKYVSDMKATLQHEHQRHQQSLTKLDEDLQLAYQHQEESRTRLCHVIEVSMGKRLPEVGRPSDQQWETMVTQWEQESAERCNPLEVVRRAYTANPPPEFGATPVPMPACTTTAPSAPVEPPFTLDPTWGPGPPHDVGKGPPTAAPPQPTPPEAYLGSGLPTTTASTTPTPPAPHGVGISPSAKERVDGARGTVKARTPPKRQDPGLSLSAKLDSKRTALKPFGGPAPAVVDNGRPGQEAAAPDSSAGTGGLGTVPEAASNPHGDKASRVHGEVNAACPALWIPLLCGWFKILPGLYRGPPTLAGTTARVARQIRKLYPSFDGLVPVQPPRSCGSVDFLAYPTCSRRSGLVHIIVDLTSVGGHYFADAVHERITVQEFLCRYAEDVKYEVEQLGVRVGPKALGRNNVDALDAHIGDAIIVMPQPVPVIWQNRLASFFTSSHTWTPLWLVPSSPFRPGVAVWLQGELYSFPSRHFGDGDICARIARLTGCCKDHLQLVTFQGFDDFSIKGEPCDDIIVPVDAFFEHHSCRSENGMIAVIDARGAGLSIVAGCLPRGMPSASSCAEAVGLQNNHDIRLQVQVVASTADDRQVGVMFNPLLPLPLPVDSPKVAISLPSSIQNAIHAIAHELDDEFYRLFSLLVPVEPQATPEWGLILALPAWALHEPVCVLDLLDVDDRIFAVVLPWWITVRDITIAADLDPAAAYDIFPFGRPNAIGPEEEVNLVPHGLIVVRPSGAETPVLRHLSGMLAHGVGWDLSTDAPSVIPRCQAGHVCVVLADRQASFTLLPGRRQHYHQDLSHIFGVPLHWLTVQVAKPPVQDAVLHGRTCKGVALICDCIPNVPIPPRRPGPNVFGIVLDCRPLLLGWRQWVVFDGQCLHSAITEHFELFCPQDHQVQIEGAELFDDSLDVSPGHVLVIQFVPVTPSSHNPGVVTELDEDDVAAESSRTEEADSVTGISNRARRDNGSDVFATGNLSRSRSPRGHLQRQSIDLTVARGVCGNSSVKNVHVPHFPGLLALGVVAGLPTTVPANTVFGDGASDDGTAVNGLFRLLPDFTLKNGDCPHASLALSAGFVGLAIESIVTACRQWESNFAPTLCRLLTEPVATTPEATAHLNALRAVTARLGGRWMRDNEHWFFDQDLEPEPDSAEQVGAMLMPEYIWICCIVLKFGYSPEEVVVAVQLPLTIDEFIQEVQQARRPECRILFPHLLPVAPQPVRGNAVLVAGPQWIAGLQGACLDTTQIDGRLFAGHVPDYVSRHELLQYADIPHNADVDVYVGSDTGALPDETPIHVFPGVGIVFQPRGSPHPHDAQLGVLLLRDGGWSEDSLLTAAIFDGDAYCLVSGQDCCLHFTDPTTPQQYRRCIAGRVGAPVTEIDIQAASPRPSDVVICGYPCRSVLAVTTPRDVPHDTDIFIVLLDCRPIQEAWTFAIAVRGVLATDEILRKITHTAPRGWHACSNVAIDEDGFSKVHAGQVIIISYAPSEEFSGPRPPVETSASSSGYTGGLEEHPREEAPRDGDGAFVDSSYSNSSRTADSGAPGVPFLLFSQEKWPEFVAPRLRLPTDIHGAIAAVEQAREAIEHRRRSRLIAVHPQPRRRWICLLALPSWQYPGVVVLIDNRLPDGGIFAVNVPHFLLRDEVLRLAGVDEASGHFVFSGDVPWPCPDGMRIPTYDGLLFTICADRNGPGNLLEVAQMLVPRGDWDLFPDLPGDSRNTSWVLTDGVHYAVSINSDTFASDNTAVAASLSLPPGQFVLVPASPFIGDHAHRGHASSLVAVACRIEDYCAEHPIEKIPYLLDLRPILLRIGWAYAPQGVVDVSELGRRLCVRCPRRHHLRLSGGLYQGDEGNHIRRVRPGEVLVAEFLPDYLNTVPDAFDPGTYIFLPGDGDVSGPAWDNHSRTADSSAASSQDAGTGGTRWSAAEEEEIRLSFASDFLVGLRWTYADPQQASQQQGDLGHPFNELADLLAGSYDVHATEIPVDIALLSDWAKAECLDWLWLYVAATRNPQHWPDLVQHSFVDQAQPSSLQVCDTHPSSFFYRQAQEDTIDDTPSRLRFCLHLVTVNVQTLEDGEQQEVPGRTLYVRSQLDSCGATITGLQETRVRETGTIASDTHLRYFAARDAKGNGGVELWFSRTLPFAWDGCTPLYFHPSDVRALAWNERYLIVRFVRNSVRITFAVIHALAATHPDRDKWWSAFGAKLHACAQDDEVVILGDWNTRFAESLEGRVGDLVWPAPHGVPQAVLDILSRHDLWVPSTYTAVHTGASHTWVAPGGNATARIDYVGVPERWFVYPACSWVLYDVDFGQTGLDHYAAAVDIQFDRTTARDRHGASPNIDVHQLSCADAQPALHSAPLSVIALNIFERLHSRHPSVLLNPFNGKVGLYTPYGKEKALLTPVIHIEAAGTFQIGGRAGQPVQLANQTVRTFQADCAAAGASCAIVFLDLKEAFHRVVRPLIVGGPLDDQHVSGILQALHLPSDAYTKLQAYVRDTPIFVDSGADAWTSGILGEVLADTWFTWGHEGRLAAVRGGTRPGDNLADMLFSFLFAEVLQRIRSQLSDLGHLFQYPWNAEWHCSLERKSAAVDHLYGPSDVTWMDDLALLFRSRTADGLVNGVQQIATVLLDECVRAVLMPNLGRGKTEAILFESLVLSTLSFGIGTWPQARP